MTLYLTPPMRWIALLLVGLLFTSLGAHGAQAVPRQPDGLLAVPALARITDAAGVLNAEQARALEDKLAAFETAHGTQIAIVIVPSVQPEPIEDYAHRIGEAWKIGRAGVGDGLLMVVATEDRRARIDVMRALEGAVPDALAKRIIREQMAPRFKTNDYTGGLNAALDSLFKLIEGEGLPPVQAPAAPPQDTTWGLLLPFIVVGVMVGRLLRRRLGVPGALLAGGVAGGAAYVVLTSVVFAGIAGVVVALLAALMGSPLARVVGGRRGGGDIFTPGGWGAGGGGGGWGSGGGGGWTSGGGGDSAGGGASGDW